MFAETSLRFASLFGFVKRTCAAVQREHRFKVRQFYILDACFAGRAKYAADRRVVSGAKDTKAGEDGHPALGSAVICSCNEHEESLAPHGQPYTLFTTALLTALCCPDADRERMRVWYPDTPLSLARLREIINRWLIARTPAREYVPPTAQVFSLDTFAGDPQDVPLFPNPLTPGGPASFERIGPRDELSQPPTLRTDTKVSNLGEEEYLAPASKGIPARWFAGCAMLLITAALGGWSLFRGPIDSRTHEKAHDLTAAAHVLPPAAASTQSATIPPGSALPKTTHDAVTTRMVSSAVIVELGLAGPTDQPNKSDMHVTYEYQRKNGALHVSYHLPYLERQREGKTIRGVSLHDPAPFDWEVPVLSVKVLNNSAESVMLTECVAEVTASQIDTEPILVVADRSVNAVLLVNEGWGDVVDPVLTFKIHPLRSGGDQGSTTVERHSLELKTFAKDYIAPLIKYVPEALEDEPAVTVSGEVEFGPAKHRKNVPFTTTMILESFPGAAVPPSDRYVFALTAGKSPDTILVPISHVVKSGEADQFLLRLASDKSAHYELKLGVRLIDGRQLPGQNVVLDVFVPRSMAKRAEKASSVDAALPAAVH